MRNLIVAALASAALLSCTPSFAQATEPPSPEVTAERVTLCTVAIQVRSENPDTDVTVADLLVAFGQKRQWPVVDIVDTLRLCSAVIAGIQFQQHLTAATF